MTDHESLIPSSTFIEAICLCDICGESPFPDIMMPTHNVMFIGDLCPVAQLWLKPGFKPRFTSIS